MDIIEKLETIVNLHMAEVKKAPADMAWIEIHMSLACKEAALIANNPKLEVSDVVDNGDEAA